MRSVRGVGESRTPAPLPLWGLTSSVGRGRRALRRGPSPQLGTEGGSGTLPPTPGGGYQRAVSPRGVCGLWWVLARQAGRPLCPLGSCHLLSSKSHSTQGRPVRGQTLSAPARTPGRVPVSEPGAVCASVLWRGLVLVPSSVKDVEVERGNDKGVLFPRRQVFSRWGSISRWKVSGYV